MSTLVPALIASLVRSLEEALAVVAERRNAITDERTRGEGWQSGFRSGVAAQCARPSPFVTSEETDESTTKVREYLEENAPAKRYAARADLQVRWETALCDAEAVLRQLSEEPQTRSAAERVAELIRKCRIISAAGPELVSPDTRRNMGDYLRTGLSFSQARLREVENLSPDVTEEEVAPLMREGLQRSVGFFDWIYDYLGEQQRATERWEAARVEPLIEALLQVRLLEADTSGSAPNGS